MNRVQWIGKSMVGHKLLSSFRSIPPGSPRKKVLLVEGGGMKGAFAGGVLTVLNHKYPAVHFDLIVAVSSGACSAAYYASTPAPDLRRGERLLDIWRHELSGHRLISIWNPLKGRHLLNQTYLIDYLFRKKYPMWLQEFSNKKLPPLYVAVCNLKKKSLEYLRATGENIFDLLKAATALPIATRGRHKIDNEWFCDAAILNPLPLEDLIQSGYRNITVVMNSPIWLESLPLPKFTRFFSFPFNRQISRLMKIWHHHHFNRARNLAMNPPAGVNLKVIAPKDILPVGLVTTRQDLLAQTVELGKRMGEEALKRLIPKRAQKLDNQSKPKKKLKQNSR